MELVQGRVLGLALEHEEDVRARDALRGALFWKAGGGVAPSIAAPLRLRVPLLVLPARPLEV